MAMSQSEPILGQSCQAANNPPAPSASTAGLRPEFVEVETGTPDCDHATVPVESSLWANTSEGTTLGGVQDATKMMPPAPSVAISKLCVPVPLGSDALTPGTAIGAEPHINCPLAEMRCDLKEMVAGAMYEVKYHAPIAPPTPSEISFT